MIIFILNIQTNYNIIIQIDLNHYDLPHYRPYAFTTKTKARDKMFSFVCKQFWPSEGHVLIEINTSHYFRTFFFEYLRLQYHFNRQCLVFLWLWQFIHNSFWCFTIKKSDQVRVGLATLTRKIWLEKNKSGVKKF